MLSLRHLSWPLKIEWLVQRTSPSLVRRTLPVDPQYSQPDATSRLKTHKRAGEGIKGGGGSAYSTPAKRTSTLDGNLTCEAGVGVLVQARVQGLGEALKVHDGQGLAVLGPRRLDSGGADLDHDQPRCLYLVEGVSWEVVREVVVGWEVVGEEVVIVEEADDLGGRVSACSS